MALFCNMDFTSGKCHLARRSLYPPSTFFRALFGLQMGLFGPSNENRLQVVQKELLVPTYSVAKNGSAVLTSLDITSPPVLR